MQTQSSSNSCTKIPIQKRETSTSWEFICESYKRSQYNGPVTSSIYKLDDHEKLIVSSNIQKKEKEKKE